MQGRMKVYDSDRGAFMDELGEALMIMLLIVGDVEKVKAYITTHNVQDIVKGKEEFVEIGKLFRFKDDCLDEMWGSLQREFGESLEKAPLSCAQAFILLGHSLKCGACSDCKNSPAKGIEFSSDAVEDAIDNALDSLVMDYGSKKTIQ